MARNINVELLSGKVYTLAVRPEMTIGELKEEVKAFNPSEDEITRILSTVEFVLHGEKLNDLQMTVSDSILDSANVQVIFYVKPAIECVNRVGRKVKEFCVTYASLALKHPSKQVLSKDALACCDWLSRSL